MFKVNMGNPAGPSTTVAPSSTSGSSNAVPKKRRTNVGKACEPCRRRRCKCDGVRPSCTTCAVYKDECYWEPREDYRKPLSRQQVQALTTRVQDLERLLREHGLDPGKASEDMGVGVEKKEPEDEGIGEHVTSDGDLGDGPGDLREWSQDHLVEGETGDLQVHGPTSAFRHLGKYSHEHSNGLEAYHDSSPEPPVALPNGFARYLPQDVYLTEQQHELAIDRFFRFYASWGQRTNPILFRQDMKIALYTDVHAKTSHYSPMLHNAILAIALGFCDEPYLRSQATRKIFAKHAKSFLDHEGGKPSVATVQALAHLASYHSLAAEHNLGWLYIGMALRCGVALGLNMDDSRMLKRGNVTAVQARERNVTFWTTFIQEGLWAPYIGRSITLPEYTAHPPTVDEQLDQLMWESKHDASSDYPIKSQPGMISTTFVETVKLMRIGERIMNTLYGIKADMSTLLRTGVISEISLSLSTWLESLPPALTFHNHAPKNGLTHILMLHLSHAWLVILLHRPFYRPLAGLPASASSGTSNTQSSTAAWAVKQCDKAAVHVITLLQTWHRLHDLRFTPPTALQCCFIAGTTHLLSMVSSRTPKKQAEALSRVQECIRLLKLIAVSWPAAQQKQILLENLLGEYGLSVASSRSSERASVDSDREGSDTPSVGIRASSPLSNPASSSYDNLGINLQPPQSYTMPVYANPAFPQDQSLPPSFDDTLYQSSREIDNLSAWAGTSISDGSNLPNSSITLNHSQQQPGLGPANTYDPFNQISSYTLSIPQPQLNPSWDPQFGFLGGELDRETQSFLDNLLQSHFDVGVAQTYDQEQ
ncbi:fungal-specific transcription factor domain-domain-containing protein [Naematelia encephala]|uniref:Fungal-specific transcription factor domain-domain-containing protein n=1 Tax=Naematelia encephala TaxID=71784 RepID=A0A1Y2BED9_9TREE|nr:fungal-specific transcription factor domain-domain-containing protein [Naematelia encephala]